ncbi:MAG: AAA family ATPase [Candidatus Micrarchaeaceae archaeon]
MYQKGGRVVSKAAPSFKKARGGARPYKLTAPLTFYWLKDIIRQLVNHKNFPDAVAVAFAIASIGIAFPSYPLALLAVLILIVAVVVMLNPLAGLMALIFGSLPMLIYQTPLLGWLSLIIASAALMLGYKHYRTITFIFVLAILPLSFVGTFLEIPAFIVGILYIGLKRSALSAILIIFLAVIISGLSGIQLSGPIAFNATNAHSSIASSPAVKYMVPEKQAANLSDFGSAFGNAMSSFLNFEVTYQILPALLLSFQSISGQMLAILLQIVVWIITVFVASSYAAKSRSGYKGVQASFFGVIIVVSYLAFSFILNMQIEIGVIISFLVAPIMYFLLEYNGINIVHTLDVMKNDFLGQLSDNVQELTLGSSETLNDVANYAQTKEELKEAVLAPIEHREIAGAYNIKPAKGILLFGPPGTGKTLIMRALSNEARCKFYYVKTSSLVSPFQGESSSSLSKIFAMARKHAPAILFFDEIDGIAGNRELKDSEEARQLLATLLSEMDGFQKIEGVVVVGSTNAPNLLDPGILRPGRFDKIIYMPLPDDKGREEIFKYYLRKLPASNSINFEKLALLTKRYSGADIKNICDETARMVSEEAIKANKVLEITEQDLVLAISRTKPSTSISQIEMYSQFKLDYERRMHQETNEKDENAITIKDVVGLEAAKRALYEAVEIPMLHPNLIKKYDIRNIRGVLLFGPPGVGKTMLMRAIASQMKDVKMLSLSGAEISKYGLERAVLTIKQTFDRARENAPAVIFIDEIDSLVPSRSPDSSMLGVEMVSEFLTEMDGIKDMGNIVVVGATNRPGSLDPALLRSGRFDKLVLVAPPNKEERAELFRRNLSKAPHSDNIDYSKLAESTSGYTGADIANICRQVKLNALEASIKSPGEATITQKDIEMQIENTRPSAPSTVMGEYMSFLSRYERG